MDRTPVLAVRTYSHHFRQKGLQYLLNKYRENTALYKSNVKIISGWAHKGKHLSHLVVGASFNVDGNNSVYRQQQWTWLSHGKYSFVK